MSKLLEKMRAALRVAADAMDIADDWHLETVEVDVSGLPGVERNGDGMVYTADLATYFRELADEEEG